MAERTVDTDRTRPRLVALAAGFLRRRPPLWREAIVIVWLVWIYDAINNLSPLRIATALAHTRSLLHLEATAHVDIEGSLNTFLSGHHSLATVVSDYYDNAHFIVSFGVLAWLWAARPDSYRRWRTVLAINNLIGFAVFWVYPMAAPRMLSGFVDTVAATGAVGSWHSGGLAAHANQYAAMPSLHVAWAAWSALAVWCTTRHRAVRAAAGLYPLLTVFAVLATANHLLVDCVAGAATTVVAIAVEANLARAWPGIRGRRHTRIPAATADAHDNLAVPAARRPPLEPVEITTLGHFDDSPRALPPSGGPPGRNS